MFIVSSYYCGALYCHAIAISRDVTAVHPQSPFANNFLLNVNMNTLIVRIKNHLFRKMKYQFDLVQQPVSTDNSEDPVDPEDPYVPQIFLRYSVSAPMAT